ncbi:MAG: site-specific integrase [Ruminococcus sp.]|nr:site-specific integrase [Ruminococcus sp.]
MSVTKTNKKKDGKQLYRVRVNYTDANGEYQQVERSVYGFAEANAKEQELIAEYKDKRVTSNSRITVKQLIDEYEKSHSQDTKKGAHDTTMRTLRLRVEPYLGGKRLDKLTPKDFENWKTTINQQKLSKGKNKGESISLRTKRNAYKTLMSLLNYAVTMEYISTNPLKRIGTFKDVNQGSSKKEMQYYTDEQFKRFINVAKKHCKTIDDWNYYVFFNILFFMGLRKGECYALTWRDIEGNVMHIRRSISQKVKDNNGNDYEDTPKTNKSIRDILIPDQLVTILNAHKKRQQEAAPEHFNEDFKVCGIGNRAIRDTSVENHNQQFAKEAKLPHIRIHDFRHSHATFLINNNVNVVAISKRLGHSSITETLNTYSHLYKTSEQEALNVLNGLKI